MLTDRQRDITFALFKAGVMTNYQMAGQWFPPSSSGLRNCNRTLADLTARGLIRRFDTVAHPELPLTEPIWTWEPGQPTPPAGSIAYRLATRWTQALRPAVVFVATTKAAKLYGGIAGRLRSCLQVTHDIHVATIYLRMLREQPHRAAAWVSEAEISSRFVNEKLPDAAIKGPDGELVTAIEFGGSYPKSRVEKLHRSFAARNLAYELW